MRDRSAERHGGAQRRPDVFDACFNGDGEPAVAQRQSARFWELRAALDLARLWRDQGRRSEARDLLAPVYGLKEAKALLDELHA
jgi:predicted ATPase